MVMKSVASVWMFLVPALIANRIGGVRRLLGRPLVLAGAVGLALVVRAAVTIVLTSICLARVLWNGRRRHCAVFQHVTKLPKYISRISGLYAFFAEPRSGILFKV